MQQKLFSSVRLAHRAIQTGGDNFRSEISGARGVVMTNEGRALRELRIMHGLSMKKAGALIGISDSYISHVENGRSDPPHGVALDRFLAVYGDIKQKSIYERVRNIREQISPADEPRVAFSFSIRRSRK